MEYTYSRPHSRLKLRATDLDEVKLRIWNRNKNMGRKASREEFFNIYFCAQAQLEYGNPIRFPT